MKVMFKKFIMEKTAIFSQSIKTFSLKSIFFLLLYIQFGMSQIAI